MEAINGNTDSSRPSDAQRLRNQSSDDLDKRYFASIHAGALLTRQCRATETRCAWVRPHRCTTYSTRVGFEFAETPAEEAMWNFAVHFPVLQSTVYRIEGIPGHGRTK